MLEKHICKNFYNQVLMLKQFKQFKSDFIIFHVPNEQRSNIEYTKHLKSIGLMAGVADYCIISEGGKASFLEFKRSKKESKLKNNQAIFRDLCEKLNIPYKVVWNVEDGIDFIKENI